MRVESHFVHVTNYFFCGMKRSNLQKWSRMAQHNRTALDAMNRNTDESVKEEGKGDETKNNDKSNEKEDGGEEKQVNDKQQ